MHGTHHARDYLFRNPNYPKDRWNIPLFKVVSPLKFLGNDFTYDVNQPAYAVFRQACVDIRGTPGIGFNRNVFGKPINFLNDRLKDPMLWTNLYAEYLRYSFKLSPSPKAITAYRAKLLAQSYRVMDDAKAKTGHWSNGDVYVYQQCVKFKACDASDDHVKAVLQTITRTEPILSQSDFPKRNPDDWWKLTGWCPGLDGIV
ncbi:uncharacterized protein Z519_02705 [Cladophialophora bantiana CBS 173.52]|uniref:Uncharacterized protein n=1 Tax=Cladophialophora bantiana (strain ATCC 10958 / CBS 173.52 / CDC B-1940 / NIH 8579) TaxID=1442370 RepID=A0A0D2HVC7_CLAB1|nr:uncharacterized protein Z519_02705 [Cladophialophora bantiana CBS 173.52]KIW97313.1 hypothetical protein Z519_02705 [Cladophialophora bantiana CBS 173.52]